MSLHSGAVVDRFDSFFAQSVSLKGSGFLTFCSGFSLHGATWSTG